MDGIMNELRPGQFFVAEVALTLEVPPSVVYYWIYSGLISAKKVRLSVSLIRDSLWDMGIYKTIVQPGYTVSTRPVRWVIFLDEIQWLLIIKQEAPQTLRDRRRSVLRALNQDYIDLMKGGQDDQQ